MFDFLNFIEVDLAQTTVDTSDWRRVLFDLEGSLTIEGDILQVAAITTDWDFNITEVFDMYFMNRKPIGEKEFSIHNISEEFLRTNANAHFTESLECTPFYSEKPTMYISYTTFDVRRINEELTHYNIPLINFGEEKPDLVTNLNITGNCHLNAFQFGKAKGSVVAKKIGEKTFEDIYEELNRFGSFPMKGSHDALYDSVLILALCRRVMDERINNPNS